MQYPYLLESRQRVAVTGCIWLHARFAQACSAKPCGNQHGRTCSLRTKQLDVAFDMEAPLLCRPESHASSAASFFSRDVAGKWIEPSIQFHRKVLPEFEFVWICPQGIHPAQPPQRRNLRSTSHLDYSEGVTRAETPSKRAYVEKWLSFAAIHPNLAFLDNLSKPS